jgi:hypothetical protein
MKITRILSASVLAGAVLLSGTACSMMDNNKSETKVSASAEATEIVETVNAVSDETAVADVVNGFYTYVSDPANKDTIKDAGEPLRGHGATATEEELNGLVASLPEGFAFFDTSNPELIKNAYVQLLLGSGLMSNGKVEASVPESAVTVTGDEATVDSSAVVVKIDGKQQESPATATPLKLKKDESGAWVMIADSIMSGGGTSSGSGSAEVELNTDK